MNNAESFAQIEPVEQAELLIQSEDHAKNLLVTTYEDFGSGKPAEQRMKEYRVWQINDGISKVYAGLSLLGFVFSGLGITINHLPSGTQQAFLISLGVSTVTLGLSYISRPIRNRGIGSTKAVVDEASSLPILKLPEIGSSYSTLSGKLKLIAEVIFLGRAKK